MTLDLRARVVAIWAGALVLAASAIVGVAAMREVQWHDRLEQAAALPLRQAWDATQLALQRRLDAALQPLMNAVAPADGGAPVALPRPGPELALLELYDPQGRRQASSSTLPDAAPLLDEAAWAAAQRDGQAAGVRLRDGASEPVGGPVLLVQARRLPDGRVLAAALDLRPELRALERQLGGGVGLTSPRGLLLAGAPPPRAAGALPGVRLALSAPGAPTTRVAAWLLAGRPAEALPPPTGWAPLWLALFVLAVFGVALTLALQRIMRPLLRPMAQLEALAEGRLQAGADDADALALPEAARLARAAERLRHELRALDALRDERQRVAAQQARLMRRQMRQLAGMLDAVGRQEILGQLVDEDTSLRPRSHTDDGQPQLVKLASLLGRLTALVGRQHTRVLELLRELRESVATREQLAGLRQELAIAHQMQQAILPRGAPPLAGMAIDATMIPARDVGGDFYDWFALDEHRLALVVADVSGKGVPAALFMAVTRTLLRAHAALAADPAQVLARLNDGLAADNEQTMFVTLFYAVLDLRSGELIYVNAGHNPPLLRRANGTVLALASGRNPALGAFEGLDFQADRAQLDAGDGLLLYTDGVTEAQTADGLLFGDAALRQVLESTAADDSPVARVVASVRAFEAGAPQADDITCVWVRRTD